jgi:3-oxoacyl-[acyl-carrier-protein] synthase-3
VLQTGGAVGYNLSNLIHNKHLGAILRFSSVSLAAIGAEVPTEIWSSQDIETRLQPLYRRLKLPEGRLELMSGIVQRRVWPEGTLPSGPSIRSAAAAIEAAGIDRARIGCLIHASVCRDFLEPATASRVHHGLQLGSSCWVYDVSNACLGLINGAIQIAMMIESGAVDAGIVVGTENSRPLLQQTLRAINEDTTLTRQSVKPAFASLTIGSGSCALLLTHRRFAPEGTTIEAAIAEARTEFHDLCKSDTDAAGAGMQPLMDTDSERLMAEGIATGKAAFEHLLTETGWRRDQLDRTVCHQVGARHRISMLDAMGLDADRDSVTFPKLGNTGSVALPLTLAAAAVNGELTTGDRLALLGIGSGINSVMLASRWGRTAVAGNVDSLRDQALRDQDTAAD